MKVVLDTNVFISGIFWKGPPFEILQAFRNRRFQLIISPEILEEYSRVLDELSLKYPSLSSASAKILELVELSSEMVVSPPLPTQLCDDPDDDKFISTALAGKAEYIVSGDKALLRVENYRGISVITAKKFITQML